MDQDDRITVNPGLMGGRPCIRRLRVPVSRIPGMLAAGEDEATILANHPDLEPEDIRQSLGFAATRRLAGGPAAFDSGDRRGGLPAQFEERRL